MRKVIISSGLLVGLAAWLTGIIGLLSTPNPHLLPIPNSVSAFGASAMLGTVLLLVIVLAHTTRAGDVD
jgi:ABC-type cobalamin transport system permease subunit